MKKTAWFMISVLLIFSMAACSVSGDKNGAGNDTTTTRQTQETVSGDVGDTTTSTMGKGSTTTSSEEEVTFIIPDSTTTTAGNGGTATASKTKAPTDQTTGSTTASTTKTTKKDNNETPLVPLG